MLEVKQEGAETYVCNYCGKTYDIRDTVSTKGNTYFCSMACVLGYDAAITEKI